MFIKKHLSTIILAVLLLVLSAASLFIGVFDISISGLFSGDAQQIGVFLASRLPRLLAILCTGVGMSVAGLIMQQLCMNKFVSPTTGATISAAELGVLIAMVFIPASTLWSRAVVSFVFAILGTWIFVAFIQRVKFKDVVMVPLVGIMFGNPEVTTGGRALKFYSSMRLDVRRIESIKVGDSVVGNRTRVKVVKNKVAPPFKQAEFDIMYGEGISKAGDILDCAVEAKLVEKAGSWYSYAGERIGQGRENVKNYLKDHPEVMDRLEGQLLDQIKKEDAQTEPEIPESDISEIMDMFVDEDGVIIEE